MEEKQKAIDQPEKKDSLLEERATDQSEEEDSLVEEEEQRATD